MIRDARIEDLPRLLEIYNYEVENGTATFDEKQESYEERKEWFMCFQGRYPLLVEELDGRVTGYAGVCQLLPKPAYDISGEVTLYIAQECQGKGSGERLMLALLERVKTDARLVSLFSLITSTNAGSIHLHEKVGFEHDGVLRQSGMKFGQYLDVEIYRYDVRRNCDTMMPGSKGHTTHARMRLDDFGTRET